MVNKRKRKGWEGENQLEKIFCSGSLPAKKQPLSGAFEGLKGDITVQSPRFGKMIGEVKVRKRAFQNLYDWLGNHDFLAVRKVAKGGNYNFQTVEVIPPKPFLIITTVDKFMELIGHKREENNSV